LKFKRKLINIAKWLIELEEIRMPYKVLKRRIEEDGVSYYVCGSCNSRVNEHDEFCNKCGQRVGLPRIVKVEER